MADCHLADRHLTIIYLINSYLACKYLANSHLANRHFASKCLAGIYWVNFNKSASSGHKLLNQNKAGRQADKAGRLTRQAG